MLPLLQNGLERGLRDSQTNLKSLLIGACGVTRDSRKVRLASFVMVNVCQENRINPSFRYGGIKK